MADSNTRDGSGSLITSTTNALDVNIKSSSGTVTVGGTVAVSNFPATQPVSGTVTANQGTANTAANSWQTEVTDGTNVLGVTAHPFRVDPTGTTTQPVSLTSTTITGTVAVTESGNWTNRIVGNAGGALDATIGAATAPTVALATLVVAQTTPPSLAAGQSVATQGDYEGSLFVKPIRRSQTVAKATQIVNSSTATTVIAAQAAGIFADLSYISITVLPVATTAITFTATLSDGTNSYVYNLSSGVSPSTGTYCISSPFNPPIPATTAATAWTVALSVATVTVNIIAVAILQKAS